MIFMSNVLDDKLTDILKSAQIKNNKSQILLNLRKSAQSALICVLCTLQGNGDNLGSHAEADRGEDRANP